MADPATIIGVAAGLTGLSGFGYQVYRTKEVREELQNEKEDLRAERDEYQAQVEEVAGALGAIQDATRGGTVDEEALREALNDVEAAVLTTDERILSRTDRILRNQTPPTEETPSD